MSKTKRIEATERTMTGLRNVLWETLDDLRSERITPASANAVSNNTGKILASVRLELDYAKAVGVRPNGGLLGIGVGELDG